MNFNSAPNFSNVLTGGYPFLFVKLVFAIILFYCFILVLGFLREKFLNQETKRGKDGISELLLILNKLFYMAGFGFMLMNLVQVLFERMSSRNGFNGSWENLSFGILCLFVGLAFKLANSELKKETTV